MSPLPNAVPNVSAKPTTVFTEIDSNAALIEATACCVAVLVVSTFATMAFIVALKLVSPAASLSILGKTIPP